MSDYQSTTAQDSFLLLASMWFNEYAKEFTWQDKICSQKDAHVWAPCAGPQPG